MPLNITEKCDVILKFSAWNVNIGCYFATCMLQFLIKTNKKFI